MANLLESLIMNWLYGEEILALFDQYFLSQSSTNQVLLIIGVGILTAIGVLGVVKWILKVTIFWVKLVLFLGLGYYIVVIVLGLDIWSLMGL